MTREVTKGNQQVQARDIGRPGRVVLVITALTPGGAERVMSIMANYWHRHGWEVSVVTLHGRSAPPFYVLDEGIEHLPLDLAGTSPSLVHGITSNLRRIGALRQVIRERRPDAVISFGDRTNVAATLAVRGLGVPILVSERMNPAVHRKRGRDGAWTRLRQWTYGRADAIVVQTETVRQFYATSFEGKLHVVPNPVMPPPDVETPPAFGLQRPAVVTMARMVHEKRLDLLLEAFARTQETHPEWTLTVLGDGRLRPELEALRERLGLGSRVAFPGSVKEPTGILQQADVFVMSSRTEGFPNALCEAMACGLPVISTDCPSGPGEIIRHGIDGLLVPNESLDGLTEAMEALMSSPDLRRRLAARAPEVVERYSLERVMGMWEDLVRSVAAKKAR